MKYKLIGSNNIFSPMETILENRGITKDLFEANESNIIPLDKIDNINEGVELLVNHFENNSNVLLVVDSDTDGNTSAAVLYRYLKSEYPNSNLKYVIHNGKEHGLSKDITVDEDVNLVILADASSNDFEQHKELKARGTDVLVIDHHECDLGYSENAIVINNQLSKEYSNKSISGVGMVYKFLKALDGYLFNDKADYYLDLVALGNVADVMNLKSKETRYLVNKGIKNINNSFIKALMKVNEYDLDKKYNYEKIGWVIAPKINGTIRSGTMEEKTKMFEAFISDNYEFCLEVADMCKKIKAKQDREVKSSLGKIEKKLKFKKIDKCIILDTEDLLSSNHRGLVAGKLADKYGVPILFYSTTNKEKNTIGGSFRGSNISQKLRTDLLNSNITTMAQGHEQAGGFELNRDDVQKLEDYLNLLYKDKEITLSKEYEVDFELESDEIEEWIVDELASYENEFGNGIDIPLLAINNIQLSEYDFSINKTNITFNSNFVKFIKKFVTKIIKEDFASRDNIKLNIIGKCTLDTYNNKGQIEIVDLEIIN